MGISLFEWAFIALAPLVMLAALIAPWIIAIGSYRVR